MTQMNVYNNNNKKTSGPGLEFFLNSNDTTFVCLFVPFVFSNDDDGDASG